MIIDFHVHVLPPEELNSFTAARFHQNVGARKGSPPTTIENVLEAAKIGGVDIYGHQQSAAQSARHGPQASSSNAASGRTATMAAAAGEVRLIVGMACTVPYGGHAFLREFERAVKQDGLKGAWITSSLQGSYPDDDDALPFFQFAQRLDVPVVMHPPSSALARSA